MEKTVKKDINKEGMTDKFKSSLASQGLFLFDKSLITLRILLQIFSDFLRVFCFLIAFLWKTIVQGKFMDFKHIK